MSDVTGYSKNFRAIFVMPDGDTNSPAGCYSNWKNGTYQFEKFHIKSVMPYIDSHFRAARGRNAVVGLSMGQEDLVADHAKPLT